MRHSLKRSILWLARALGLFAWSRRLTGRQLRILCYHGGNLGDEHRFNSLLFCPATHLDRRLQWLRTHGFTVLSLSEALEGSRPAATAPTLPTVLTFDDGWYSTYRELAPVVARHGVPATLYLCTSYFASKQPVPDVSLNYLLWKAGTRRCELKGLSPTLDGDYALSSLEDRRRLVDAALPWLQDAVPVGAVVARLRALARQLGISDKEFDLESRRFSFVDEEELRCMREQGWSVELHGHQHRYPAGQPDLLKADLRACQAELARLGLPRGTHYCYPSGNHDALAHDLLSAEGVASATTCLPGLVDLPLERRQRHYLPRFLDGEGVDPLEFEAEMSGFTHLMRRLLRR